MSDTLTKQKCVPCKGGIPPLTASEYVPFLEKIDSEWKVIDEKKIRREFMFENFPTAINFVNQLADVAEEEGHHPDLYIHYNKVTVDLLTHKINGLHDNDFILAAKIDKLYLEFS